jgi:DNA-binding GntR family transcriptional regulator
MTDPAITITERVYTQIRQAIVEGEIAAGSKLSEPELARHYGVSRGPLREAMRRLEAASLVELKANIGARVVALSSAQLLEIYLVREALEGMAGRLAAENMPDQQIINLRALLETHQRHMERLQDSDGWAYFQKEGDLDFHYRIVQGSGNSRLIRLLCNDLYHLVRMYRFQFGMSSPRARPAYDEHRLIVDAIEARDGEQAEMLMRFHIRASRRNVERQLADNNETKARLGLHPQR